MPVERKNKNGAGRGSTQSCCEWFLHTGLWNLKGQEPWEVVVGGDPKWLTFPMLQLFSLEQFQGKVSFSRHSFNLSATTLTWNVVELQALNKYYLNKTAPTPVGERCSWFYSEDTMKYRKADTEWYRKGRGKTHVRYSIKLHNMWCRCF